MKSGSKAGPAARLVVAWGLAVALASCADLGRRRARDAGELAREVEARIGAELAPGGPALGAEGLSEQAQALLAEPLDEDAAVKVALLENRAVRAAFEELGVASAELVGAGLIANPIFSGSLEFFDEGTEIELGLSQPLLDVFYRSMRIDLAEAELAAARARVAQELVRLAFDVRRDLVRLRAAHERLELQRGALVAAQQSAELMRALHQAGNVTDPARTREELGALRATLDEAAAQDEARSRRERLLVRMGLRSDPGFTLVGGLPDDPAAGLADDDGQARALEASFALAALRAEGAAAARRAGLSGWAAELDPAEIGVGATREADDEWGVGPSIAVGLPIFDRGTAGRAAAQARLRAALARQAATEVEVRSAARDRHAHAVAVAERARRARDELLPLRARLVRETLREYNAMQIGAFDVLVARQLELAAGREAVELLELAWLARLDLEELYAGALDEHAERTTISGHTTSPVEVTAGAGH